MKRRQVIHALMALSVAAALCFCTTGCGGTDPASDADPTQTETAADSAEQEDAAAAEAAEQSTENTAAEPSEENAADTETAQDNTEESPEEPAEETVDPAMLEAVAGTYVCEVFNSERDEFIGDHFHREYMVGINPASETNTLVLNADGSYEYTKLFTGGSLVREGTIDVHTTFYGQYSTDETVVLLAYPDEVIWNHDWAFYEGYIGNCEGVATDGDLIEGLTPPRYYFAGKYHPNLPSSDREPVVVTIDRENATFVYEGDASSLKAPLPPAVEFSDTPCEEHRWNALTGHCKICGAECPHDEWDHENGQCLACRYFCEHPDGKHTEEQRCVICGKLVAHHFIDGVCDCGAEAPYGFECEKTPEEYLKDCDEKGTVERVEYQTAAYDMDGNRLEDVTKVYYAYLPYGYDPSKPYNVMYLYHGFGSSERYWFGMDGMPDTAYDGGSCKTLQLLDNLIKNGEMEPTIVVTPSLNTNDQKVDDDILHYEIVRDLIPDVETRYSTYAHGDVSRDSLIASRRHRALGGLSAGSRITRTTLPYVLEYMSWYASMAHIGNYTEDYFPAVKAKAEQGYDIDMYYNACGFKDEKYMDHRFFVEDLFRKDPNGEIFTEENLVWVDKNDNAHTYQTWLSDLYNVGRVFFKDIED